MMRCPTCLVELEGGFTELGRHIFNQQIQNDAGHITWINRYVGRSRTDEDAFISNVTAVFQNESLKEWIVHQFVRKFYGADPHQLILAMQRPSKFVLLGYAYEHHHFLKQWVKSCASIISNTDIEEVQHYELDNISSEWHGAGSTIPSHHELLLRMGESYGVKREDIYATEALDSTKLAISTWDYICRDLTFVEGMAAMHSLELIANRNIRNYGSSVGYFNPEILSDGSVTMETAEFLKEGYHADVIHSEVALDLIEKYSKKLNLVQPVQAIVMKSMEEFDNYLNARLERGAMLENK